MFSNVAKECLSSAHLINSDVWMVLNWDRSKLFKKESFNYFKPLVFHWLRKIDLNLYNCSSTNCTRNYHIHIILFSMNMKDKTFPIIKHNTSQEMIHSNPIILFRSRLYLKIHKFYKINPSYCCCPYCQIWNNFVVGTY